MIKRLALATTLTVLGVTSAHAEFLGLPNGRSADTTQMAPLSVEGAFNTGDGYQNIGARVNYSLSPDLVVFGDLALTEFGEGSFTVDGLSFGIGAYYFLANQQILPQVDIAVKGSFHSASLEGDSETIPTGFNPVTGQVTFGTVSSDVSGTNISFETLVSGKEAIAANGLGWYANAGLNLLGGDFDETEILLGGGLTLPAGPGEAYAGIDLIDEAIIGIGYRYSVQ